MEVKQKKCKCCKTPFKPFRSTQVVCSPQCATELAKIKQEQKEKRERALEHKLLKENFNLKHKSLSKYEAEAKVAFQRWIRERDAGLPCISCGNPNPLDWAGGHFYAAGLYSGMIFEETNCHAQCNSYCNMHLSGNLSAYRQGLINRYGKDYVSKLDEMAIQKRNYKYSKEELIDIKAKYSRPFTASPFTT